MKKIRVGVLVLFLVLSVYVVAAPESERMIVVFHETTDVALLNQYGDVEQVFHLIPAAVVTLSQPAVDALEQNPAIDFIQPDYYRVYFPPAPAGEPSFSAPPDTQVLPWGVDRIDAELAWSVSTGSGIKVGIIDTGIDRDHPDLVANIKGGFNTIAPTPQYPDPTDFEDDHGHGTHCAGIIGAVDNTFGVVGVAPDAWLYGVKAFNSGGGAYTSDCIEGIEWCIDNGMQVISMSWGSYSSDPALEAACKAAWDFGAVLVAAAGNEGYLLPNLYPAAYSYVMAISATDINDNVVPWSNYGDEIELAAPGASIYSTYLGGGYAYMSGTSMACPHVSGTVALVFAGPNDISNRTLRTILWKTAEDLGAPGWDPYYGYGLVDAERAVYH